MNIQKYFETDPKIDFQYICQLQFIQNFNKIHAEAAAGVLQQGDRLEQIETDQGLEHIHLQVSSRGRGCDGGIEAASGDGD